MPNKDCAVCIRQQCPLPHGTPDVSGREIEVASPYLGHPPASLVERLADCETRLLNRLRWVPLGHGDIDTTEVYVDWTGWE